MTEGASNRTGKSPLAIQTEHKWKYQVKCDTSGMRIGNNKKVHVGIAMQDVNDIFIIRRYLDRGSKKYLPAFLAKDDGAVFFLRNLSCHS